MQLRSKDVVALHPSGRRGNQLATQFLGGGDPVQCGSCPQPRAGSTDLSRFSHLHAKLLALLTLPLT